MVLTRLVKSARSSRWVGTMSCSFFFSRESFICRVRYDLKWCETRDENPPLNRLSFRTSQKWRIPHLLRRTRANQSTSQQPMRHSTINHLTWGPMITPQSCLYPSHNRILRHKSQDLPPSASSSQLPRFRIHGKRVAAAASYRVNCKVFANMFEGMSMIMARKELGHTLSS